MSDQVCLVVGSEIMGSNKYLNTYGTLFKTAIVIKVMETFFFFKNTLKSQRCLLYYDRGLRKVSNCDISRAGAWDCLEY